MINNKDFHPVNPLPTPLAASLVGLLLLGLVDTPIKILFHVLTFLSLLCCDDSAYKSYKTSENNS